LLLKALCLTAQGFFVPKKNTWSIFHFPLYTKTEKCFSYVVRGNESQRQTTRTRNPIMTKAQELEILTEAARKLGSDSYCGPLLEMLIPMCQQDMLSDIAPDFDLRKAQGDCFEIRERTRHESAAKITAARVEAEKIVEAAR
jgi:hypothetical protein